MHNDKANKSIKESNENPSVSPKQRKKAIKNYAKFEVIVHICLACVSFAMGLFVLQTFYACLAQFGTAWGTWCLEKILDKKSFTHKKYVRDIKKCILCFAIFSTLGYVSAKEGYKENFLAGWQAFKEPSLLREKPPTFNGHPEYLQPKNMTALETEWLDGQEGELVEIFNNICVTQADYEMAAGNNLSEQIKAEVFLLGDSYEVCDWDDENEIQSKVGALIDERLSMGKKNIFDSNATQEEKDEISAISENEENITETIYLNKKIEDLHTRLNYYSRLPKAGLALLCSNDYHLLALIAYCYDFEDNAKLYYYVKSIQYGLEYISYSGLSDEDIKSKLLWISARYQDIYFTCKNTDEAALAQKLAKAFKNKADEY